MAKPEKVEAVAEFKQNLQDNKIAILTKYTGINVAKMTDLRKQLRDQQVTFKVYKNTLAKRALDELNLGEAAKYMDGPTAWAFCKDPLTPAKLLKAYAREAEMVQMQGGVLEGRVVNRESLIALADLPSREVLLGRVVGTIAAPLSQLVGALSALPRNLVNVLDQVRKQKEEAGAAA